MEMSTAVSFASSIPIPRTTPVLNLAFSSSLSLCCSPSLWKKASGAVSSGRGKQSRRRNKGLTCNALFGLGVPELVVIAGVAALVFGPKQLPEVGRSIGKTFKSFQQAAKEFESELKKEPDSTGAGPSEKPIALSEKDEQDIEVSSSKESVRDL